MQRLAALLFTTVGVLAQQVAIEGHWKFTTTSDFNKDQVIEEFDKAMRFAGTYAISSILAHEENGLMAFQMYESEADFAAAFNKTSFLNSTNQFVKFTEGKLFSQDFVSQEFSKNVSELFSAQRSQLSSEFFESRYDFGPPVQGWINLPLSTELDMIFQAQVYHVYPGAKNEVTEVVDLMTAFFKERADLNQTLSTFQARWLDDSHFVLYTVYRNSSGQAYIFENAGDQLGDFYKRLDDVTDTFPVVIIGDTKALGKLTADFRFIYSEEKNHYVIGTPNIEILLSDPTHFGWYRPPIITETQLNLLQGGLGLGNFAYVGFYQEWWSVETIFDATLVLEAAVGVVQVALAGLAFQNEDLLKLIRETKLYFAIAELLVAGGYFYQFMDDTDTLNDLIGGLIVHPVNALVDVIYWAFFSR